MLVSIKGYIYLTTYMVTRTINLWLNQVNKCLIRWPSVCKCFALYHFSVNGSHFISYSISTFINMRTDCDYMTQLLPVSNGLSLHDLVLIIVAVLIWGKQAGLSWRYGCEMTWNVIRAPGFPESGLVFPHSALWRVGWYLAPSITNNSLQQQRLC